MSKAEVLAELPRLSPADLAEVQAKLDELTGDRWHNSANLSEGDKAVLDATLADYAVDPEAGSTWEQVKARVEAKLRP